MNISLFSASAGAISAIRDASPLVFATGNVNIWESTSGRCIHKLEGPADGVEWISWHPKGDVILAGSEDFTTWMWNAQTGAMMQAGPHI